MTVGGFCPSLLSDSDFSCVKNKRESTSVSGLSVVECVLVCVFVCVLVCVFVCVSDAM